MIPVVDLFAGPGGLNEGFSSVEDDEDCPVFKTVASFEMDPWAVKTLRLRTAFRELKRQGDVSAYYDLMRGERPFDEFRKLPGVSEVWRRAEREVHELRLGEDTRAKSDRLILAALNQHGAASSGWVLIGGPPCQAYSLAGRSRRTNDKTFEQDEKHFLFREYLHILRKFQPAIFVMENVKGLLSSTHGGRGMFARILSDLSTSSTGHGYEIRSLVVPSGEERVRPEDFIIRTERFGIPQRRHRVILLGVRKDLAAGIPHWVLTPADEVDLKTAIGDLPRLRSGISPKREDDWDTWAALRDEAHRFAAHELGGSTRSLDGPLSKGSGFVGDYAPPEPTTEYQRWILDPKIGGVTLHEARRHMDRDLLRYGFLSRVADVRKRTYKLDELPSDLMPKHENVGRPDTPFTDRFRVQLWDAPSTTIVSHISKDGHYYIHPDSAQMRSLTVREAARLQSFPDNYMFMGGRTQQYHQVGNAVPPLLARQIATLVGGLLRVDSVG